jgi:A/G-specific adenine glycosylase
MDHCDLAALPGLLLPWYNEHKRELPWRADRDPYHIWLSEIMLQQTRVEAVKGYYARFLEALPTINALADCDDELLHKLWEGLGYYSRVRNLKKAANVVMAQYGGVFPGEYAAVRALPGIGDYTAGAVCSICFQLPTPAVDGNVLRVISRIQNDPTPIDLPARKKEVQTLLAKVYPEESGDFTQALMELGATICGPNRKPDCENCPCKAFCLGYQQGTAENLPVKSPKKSRRQEDLTVFVLRWGDCYALEKRPESGLLAGLWQFPNCPGSLDAAASLAWASEQGLKPADIRRIAEKKHIFTHIQWNMRGIYLEVSEKPLCFQWFSSEEIEKSAALPTAFRQFWEERDYV